MGNSCSQMESYQGCQPCAKSQDQKEEIKHDGVDLIEVQTQTMNLVFDSVDSMLIPFRVQQKTKSDFVLARKHLPKKYVHVRSINAIIHRGTPTQIQKSVYEGTTRGNKLKFQVDLEEGNYILIMHFQIEKFESQEFEFEKNKKDKEKDILNISNLSNNKVSTNATNNMTAIAFNAFSTASPTAKQNNTTNNPKQNLQSDDNNDIIPMTKEQSQVTQKQKEGQIRVNQNSITTQEEEDVQQQKDKINNINVQNANQEQENNNNNISANGIEQQQQDNDNSQVQNNYNNLSVNNDNSNNNNASVISEQSQYFYEFTFSQYPKSGVDFNLKDRNNKKIQQMYRVLKKFQFQENKYNYFFKPIQMNKHANVILPIKIVKTDLKDTTNNKKHIYINFRPKQPHSNHIPNKLNHYHYVEQIKVFIFEGKISNNNKLGKLTHKDSIHRNIIEIDDKFQVGDYTMLFKLKYNLKIQNLEKGDYEFYGLSSYGIAFELEEESIKTFHDFGGY